MGHRGDSPEAAPPTSNSTRETYPPAHGTHRTQALHLELRTRYHRVPGLPPESQDHHRRCHLRPRYPEDRAGSDVRIRGCAAEATWFLIGRSWALHRRRAGAFHEPKLERCRFSRWEVTIAKAGSAGQASRPCCYVQGVRPTAR